MDEQIKQIGERLKGLRDVLDIPEEEIANLCGLSVKQYEKMESGESELSVSTLQKISKRYGIALDVLLFGEEPHMHSYFLTRKGKGLSVEPSPLRSSRRCGAARSTSHRHSGTKASWYSQRDELTPGTGIQHGSRRIYGIDHWQERIDPERGRQHLF